MDDSEEDDRGPDESPKRPLKGQACRDTSSKSSNDDEREDGANDGQEQPSGSEGSPSKKKSRDNIPEPLSSLHGLVPGTVDSFVGTTAIVSSFRLSPPGGCWFFSPPSLFLMKLGGRFVRVHFSKTEFIQSCLTSESIN